MQRLALVVFIFGLTLLTQGCAVYVPPYSYPLGYYGYTPYYGMGYGYRPYGYYGYRPRHHGWGGYGWRGWGHWR